MTARLLSWPNGLKVTDFTRVSGPVSAGSSQNLTLTGASQHISAVKSPIVFNVSVPPQQGQRARRVNGLMTALRAGANAVRFPFNVVDEMPDPSDLGLSAFQELNWSNGEPWSNGRGWQGTYPTETVTAAADIDTSIINLGSTSWGDKLSIGDYVGFRSHFALYEITQDYYLEPNKYRVWPPLRKAITTDDVATLEPTMVVRSVGEFSRTKTPSVWQGQTLTFVEVNDPDVRTYYTED